MNDYICIPFEIVKNIGAAIPLLRHAKEKHSQRRYDLLVDVERPFRVFAKLIKRSNGMLDIRDKLILEIGPGNSFAMAMLFIAHGAKKVYLVDRFKHLFWDDHDINFHKHIIDRLKNSNYSFSSIAIEAISFNKRGSISFDCDRIEYRFGDAANLPIDDESVDFVFSNAVLEHVHHIHKAIKEIARITKTSGIGAHEIDLRDHFFQNTPLRLLQYSDYLWNLMAWYRPGYTNRLRLSDYLSLFKNAGFSVKKLEPSREYDGNFSNIKMNKTFKIYPPEELKVLAFYTFLQKEGNNAI